MSTAGNIYVGPPFAIGLHTLITDPVYVCVFYSVFHRNGKKKRHIEFYTARHPDDIETYRRNKITELMIRLDREGIRTVS